MSGRFQLKIHILHAFCLHVAVSGGSSEDATGVNEGISQQSVRTLAVGSLATIGVHDATEGGSLSNDGAHRKQIRREISASSQGELSLFSPVGIESGATQQQIVPGLHTETKSPGDPPVSDNATGFEESQLKPKPKVLYAIFSGSDSYNTRIRWGLDTWAKGLAASELLVIGDQEPISLGGTKIHTTGCRANNLWHDVARDRSLCCKYAEAVVAAHTMMKQNANLEWAYFADDATYIRTAAIEAALLKETDDADTGIVMGGGIGCSSSDCTRLLCGEGGFGANRRALEVMVQDDAEGFIKKSMVRCEQCTEEGGGLDSFALKLGVKQKILSGAYVWQLEKSCFDRTLLHEPLVYHPVQTQQQFQILQGLFIGTYNTSEDTSSSGSPSESAIGKIIRWTGQQIQVLHGRFGAPQEPTYSGSRNDCANFRGSEKCASGNLSNIENRPWLEIDPKTRDPCPVELEESLHPATPPGYYLCGLGTLFLTSLFLCKGRYK